VKFLDIEDIIPNADSVQFRQQLLSSVAQEPSQVFDTRDSVEARKRPRSGWLIALSLKHQSIQRCVLPPKGRRCDLMPASPKSSSDVVNGEWVAHSLAKEYENQGPVLGYWSNAGKGTPATIRYPSRAIKDVNKALRWGIALS
jgi:hypothetical protein